jgi:flagellar biogenesis protein FliO
MQIVLDAIASAVAATGIFLVMVSLAIVLAPGLIFFWALNRLCSENDKTRQNATKRDK